MSLNFEHEWEPMSSWDLARVVVGNQPFTSPFVCVGELECHFVLHLRNDDLVLRSEFKLQNGHPVSKLSSARCSLDITFKYTNYRANTKEVSSHRTPSGQGVTGKVFWVEYEDIIPDLYFERITIGNYLGLRFKLTLQTVANSEFSTMKASADLSTLLQKGDFWDVLLVSSDGQEFRAHRNILSARSPVFAAMLTTDMKEKNEQRVLMENMDADLVEAMLEFVYSGTLKEQEVRPGFHEELFGIADQYALPDLRAAVLSAIRVDEDNYGKLLVLADRHGDTKLKGRILDFIALNCSELKKRSNSLFDV